MKNQLIRYFPFLFHVTRSGHSIQQDGMERWDRDLVGPEERGGPAGNFRNEIEILGGLLKVAERICWGWKRWTAGEVRRISGKGLGDWEG